MPAPLPEEATSLTLPASFTESETSPRGQHVAETMAEDLLTAVAEEGSYNHNTDTQPTLVEEDVEQEAMESFFTAAGDSSDEDVAISAEEIVGDLIDMEMHQEEEEEQVDPIIEVPSFTSRSLPEPLVSGEPPNAMEAATPVASNQPRKSPVSAMQELDDTAEEFSPPNMASDSSPSTSCKASNPEEDAPIDESVKAEAAPFDEVCSTTPEKTKVTFIFPEKEAMSNNEQEPDIVSNLYGGVKGAWMWSKSHIPLANIWMGLTESVANSVLELATGNGLHSMDEKVIRPQLYGLDAKVLNPAIHALVDAVLKSNNSKEQNPLHSILLALLGPPVRFLVGDEDAKLTGETSTEG